MKRILWAGAAAAVCWLLAATALLCGVVHGQEPQLTRAPDLQAMRVMEGYPVPSIPGVAFSARAAMLIRIRLADGTVVERKVTTLLARDSLGRVYNDRRRIVPAADEEDSPLLATDVYDPVKGTRTECVLAAQVCTVTAAKPRQPNPPVAEGVSPDGKFTTARTVIGTEILEGVEVRHVREKRVYAAGAQGNSQPMTMLSESWYSPLLQIYLVQHVEFSTGTERTIRVMDISLAEPEGNWFAVPEGFRVVNALARGGAAKTQ